MKSWTLTLPGALFVLGRILALPAAPAGEPPLDFEPGDTLEEIRYKIDQNGFQFTVDHNWVFDMSPEEKARFFLPRARRTTAPRRESDEIGPLARRLGRVALPPGFDWRNFNGRSYIGPIRDQGDCGSCYAFGACAAAEGVYNFANGLYGGSCVDFSESYIIWCLGRLPEYSEHFFGCDGSDYDYMELEAICTQGVTGEAYFPYTVTDPGYCTHWNNPTTVFQGWYRVPCNDVNAIKTAILVYGIVDAAVEAGVAFQAYGGGIYSDFRTTCLSTPCYETPTDHVIGLVGWVDNTDTPHWILRNQWGTDWGEDGYMRIAYTSARVACEACYLVYRADRPEHTDFNGNGKSDPAVFRPSTGRWAVKDVTRAYLGNTSDAPAAGDYDGDGLTDIATYRSGTGLWAIRGITRLFFGTTGDSVSPGDYNGDGRTDLGVFRPAEGLWAVKDVTRVYFGGSGDLPAPGYFSGGDALDLAVYRPAEGLWAVRACTRVYLGTVSDEPVAGDYDGNGAWEAAIFRPATGMWRVRGVTTAYFGNGTDSARPGDYDGDGADEIGIFRPSTGMWGVLGFTRLYFGSSPDEPVTR